MTNRVEFNTVLNEIADILRRTLHIPGEHRFDIDSRPYRKDLFDDFSVIKLFLPDSKAAILDLGCGKGHHTAALAGLGYQNVLGLDLIDTEGEGGAYNASTLGSNWQAETWAALSERYGTRYAFYDGVRVPYEDNAFDAVILYAVIEHVEPPLPLLLEVTRVLKPGGRAFVFRCPNKLSYTEKMAELLGLKAHDKRYSRAELIELFTRAGLFTERVERYDHFPAFCPVKKLQPLWDAALGGLCAVDFVFKPPFMNLFSHHYRAVLRNDKPTSPTNGIQS